MTGALVRAALALDGGLSSQLAVRGADGELSRWANWRKVPLGLVVTPIPDPSSREDGR